jgi:hypothetical protein
MRIKELVMESRKIDEAPMGMLNKFGNKVASKFGSDQATGRLKSGDVANKLYSAFNQYLGQSGQQPTWPVVSKWLEANKYPIKKARQVVQSAKADAAMPKGPGVMDKIKQGAGNIKNKISTGMNNMANKAMDAAGAPDAMGEGKINEAQSAPLDKKTLEKVFMAAAQEAAVIVQQRKQAKAGGGQQQGQRGGLSVQQGGKSQGSDPQLAQAVGDLEQRVSNLEKQAGAVKPTRKRA